MASYGSASHEVLTALTASSGPERESLLRASFLRMSLCFAITHGVCTTPLILASSVLDEHTAYVGSGVLYVAALVGSLLLAAPVCATFGLRRALVVGGILYCVYIGGFALAVALGPGPVQWATFVACSAAGGLAGANIWVAQGAYFAETGDQLAAITGETPQAVKAKLAGDFSKWYLLFEVLAKVGFTLLQQILSLAPAVVSLLYLVLGIISVVVLSSVEDLKVQSIGGTTYERITSVVSLWSDPLIWLLSPVNLTFGFCAAFMNGYVNGVFLKDELGEPAVAGVGAITPLVGAVAAVLFTHISGVAGKGPVISIGAVCFLLIPICLLLLGCCRGWGWWMISLYILQGLGRAVFESTNRAAFADFFPDDNQSAFANCSLQVNTAFALSFFLQTVLTQTSLATVVMLLAGLTPLSYWLASLRASLRSSPGERKSAV